MRRFAMSIPIAGAAALALLLTPPAPAVEQPVRVTAYDTRGDARAECPDVVTSGRFVEGGCRSLANSSEVHLMTRTVVGALPFAYGCSFAFDLTIAGDGRVWMDRLMFGGGTAAACNDVRPCEPNALRQSAEDRRWARRHSVRNASSPTDFVPWPGRLRPAGDGRFVADLSVCLDTCAGRYDGDLELTLVRRAGRWTLVARDAPIGATGLTFDAEWLLQPGRFDLSSSPPGDA